MSRIRVLVAQEADADKRLDKFLSEKLAEKSRTQIQRMIEGKSILVGGKVCKTSYKIRGGDQIQVSPLEPTVTLLAPESIPLQIIYEDADLAVINKPAGMIVHSGAGVHHGTLVNALLYHFRELSKCGGSDRPGIVHRLDKQTSGLIVVAKNDLCHQKLSRQFHNREVTKKYIALVHGSLQKDSGEIKSPIGRDRIHRAKMTTRSRRSREAHTLYQVLERLPGFTLLQLQIKTGRTHQIRVHLSSMKHPVVGDILYGAPARILLPGNRAVSLTLGRNFLHAASLEFSHPTTQAALRFLAELPEELKSFLQQLRGGPSQDGPPPMISD